MQYQSNPNIAFNTPIKNFDQKYQQHQSYTPLESTAEPGRYGMMSRQRSQVSYRDRSPTPVSNLERINNPKPRNITNFDMPVHRAGKRNINCRSATDNNIFNLQSLQNIRARGSGQPNQQINQRNQNKSSMGRSASFVNLDEIKKSQRFPQKIPHFTSTVFNHQLEQETRNTGRFLTTYGLTARSLSPFARKDSKFQDSLRQKDQLAHVQRKKGFVTKIGNQNMKNWTTLNLGQQDGIALMYQRMKSERICKDQMKRSHSQLINQPKTPNQGQYSTNTDRIVNTFKPQNLKQAKAYNKFLSKSAALSPNASENHSPSPSFSHRQQNQMLSTLPSPQIYQEQQNIGFQYQASPTKQRKQIRQSSPISNFDIRRNLSPTKATKSQIIDRTNDKQSMGGSEYSYRRGQQEIYVNHQNSPSYKNARSDFVGGNNFNNIHHHTGRLLTDFADNIEDDVKSEINIYRDKYSQPQWKIKKEVQEKQKEIEATVNNSVNFNPTSKKFRSKSSTKAYSKRNKNLGKSCKKFSTRISRCQKHMSQIIMHKYPRTDQYTKRLDLQDNNFVERMSGDPQRHRHNYLDNMRQQMSKRVGQDIVSGQSVNYQKKQKLHGAPSFLSAQQRAMAQKLGRNYVAQGTSIDIGQITPQMIQIMKQNHHQKLKAQIEMERQHKLQQRIRKYEDQAIEQKQIQEKNIAHSQQQKYISDMKKLQLKHYIERQKREKQIQSSMAYGEKSRLLMASREKNRQMEEVNREQREARRAITLKIADIQRAQMALKNEDFKVKKAVAKITKSPRRMSPLSYSPERSIYAK